MVEALGKRPCDNVPDVGVTENGASSYVSRAGPGQWQRKRPHTKQWLSSQSPVSAESYV